MNQEQALSILKSQKIYAPVALLGVRGYYSEENKRNVYDDALFVVGEHILVPFAFNSDPSIFQGSIASLVPGIYHYRIGTHGVSRGPTGETWPALVQADTVIVRRDDGTIEAGWFGINFHQGSNQVTSSEGCQTLPPPEWKAFISLVCIEILLNKDQTIPYLLVEKESILSYTKDAKSEGDSNV